MVKDYETLKDGTFPKPYDRKGLKIVLEEKRAKPYVEKGDIQAMQKPKPQSKGKRAPKKDE